MTDKIGFEYHVCHRPLMHQHPFFFVFFPKPETSLMAHGLYVLRPAGKGAGMGKEHLLRGPTPHPSVLPSLTSQPQSGPCQARSTSDDPYASQIADKGPPGGLPSLEQPSSPSSWLAEPARRSPAWDQWVQQAPGGGTRGWYRQGRCTACRDHAGLQWLQPPAQGRSLDVLLGIVVSHGYA